MPTAPADGAPTRAPAPAARAARLPAAVMPLAAASSLPTPTPTPPSPPSSPLPPLSPLPPVPSPLARWWRGHVRVPGELSGPAMLCLVFIPYALGHYISWLLRSVNAMLAPQLMAAAHVTPAQLGILTSTYFFAFALAQLPVGIALDRYGPRRVQGLMLLVAALGTLAFAASTSFMQLAIARGLMGLGLAGCFMAAVKAISTWISPAKAPSVQGYLIAAGGLGAASSTLPVRLALHYMDWRVMLILLAAGCVVIALMILLLAPTPPAAPPRPFSRRLLADVFRHPAFLQAISVVLVPHTIYFGIQGLWIARWLADVAHFGEQAIAWLLYLGMAGVIFGAIATGMITEWASRRGIAPIQVAAAGVALFVLVQCGFVLDWRPSYQLLAVAFTLVGTVTGIEYSIVAQSVPSEMMGRAATCLNLSIFIGAFLVQSGFGEIISLWPPGSGSIAYRCAFSLLVLLQLPGLCLYLRGRRIRGR